MQHPYFTTAPALLLILSVTAAAKPDNLEQPHVSAPGASPQLVDAAIKPKNASEPSVQARLNAAYGQLPLSFEINQGQTAESVQFLSRGQGYTLFLTKEEAVLALNHPMDKQESAPEDKQVSASRSAVISLQLLGANRQPDIVGVDLLPGKSNYFVVNDPARWHTDIPHYAKVKYTEVYPGIDLLYYGNQRQLEYDFVVSPGRDPNVIRLAFIGTDTMEIDTEGNLILHTPEGALTQHRPLIYQENQGQREHVEGQYVILSQTIPSGQDEEDTPRSGESSQQVGFHIAAYDTARPLIIDPVLSYSTYLGGSSGDGLGDIAVDASGNAYVSGSTLSVDYPVSSDAFDRTCGTDGQCNPDADRFIPRFDIVVAKLNAIGTALLYSTYLGGSSNERGSRIAVDNAGSAYVAGTVVSTDFPTTPGAFDRTCGTDGTCNITSEGLRSTDGFITKLNAAGNGLLYSTYLGGRDTDQIEGLALDSLGNIYLTGDTGSNNFPVTPGALDEVCSVGSVRCGFRVSNDAFVTKLNAVGSALVYSTFLGGSGGESGQGIAVDTVGNAYVAGNTDSTDFPTVNALQANGDDGNNIFISKINAAGSALTYSTYLGGSNLDNAFSIALDDNGSVYLTGRTFSTDFPITPNALDAICDRCSVIFPETPDSFVTKLTPTGNALAYSTYLGGEDSEEGVDIAVDGKGQAYVTGLTFSPDFPVFDAIQPLLGSNDFGETADAYVAKLNTTGTALIYSTYLGGTSRDVGFGIAVDDNGNAFVVGDTASANFPTTPGALDTTCGATGDCLDTNGELQADGFIARISETPATVLCLGLTPTVFGTPGNDLITGSLGADVIEAGDGNDRIFGFGGDDVICGGVGNDSLFGGDGNDRLLGQSGEDRLFGGEGQDRLFGHGGEDELFGGEGNDVLGGGPGDDQLFGGSGAGRDILAGDAGDDRLFGNAGEDKLFGGAGNDTLNGGAQTDLCQGGPHTLSDVATQCETVSGIP